MNYRFIVINNKLSAIIEHDGQSVLATTHEVYTGSIDWAIKNLPLLGIDINLIYEQNLAERPFENPLKIVPISGNREFHVITMPINSESKFFVVRGFIRYQDDTPDIKIDLLADDNSLVNLPGGGQMGEFSYYKQLISEGYPLLDLVEQGILQRDADGTIDRKIAEQNQTI